MIFLSLFLTACSNSRTIEIGNPVEKEVATIQTNVPGIFINATPLEQNARQEISIGINQVRFSGPVILNVNKEPLLKANKETVTAASVGACVAVLPLCPLSLLLVNVAYGETSQAEVNCKADIELDAWSNENYKIKLVEVENDLVELRINNKDEVTITSTGLDCEQKVLKCTK